MPPLALASLRAVTTLTLAASTILAPTRADAQAQGVDSVVAVLERLDRDAWLRLAVGDVAADRLEGRLVALAPETLTLRTIFPPPDRVTVPLTHLRAVWQKDGAYTWRGALLGGLLLGALGARLGSLGCSDTGIDTTGCQLTLGAGGAVAGAGIGALLGASYPRWRLVYERPPR